MATAGGFEMDDHTSGELFEVGTAAANMGDEVLYTGPLKKQAIGKRYVRQISLGLNWGYLLGL
jgi:hypothetical protein